MQFPYIFSPTPVAVSTESVAVFTESVAVSPESVAVSPKSDAPVLPVLSYCGDSKNSRRRRLL